MTVKEVAMTDILSTKWRYLWKNFDHLILDTHSLGMQVLANSNYRENPDFWSSEATRFVHKVNEVLRHHNGNRVKKFKVHFPLTSAHASELDGWVTFAAASHTESLVLCLCDEHGMATRHAELYDVPLKHFSDVRGCQLRQLWITNCSLETVPANLNGFSYLVSLLLNHV
uniref:At1g61320/AtMIF1 LRR domain-containing protein n=1 Tax=Arundo donax TaxID=35708 RepID=A0A0A9BME6_ARUDO